MAPPKTEEEMRSFMADYERRLALEERPLRISNVGAWLGFMVSGGLLYLLYCVDDVSSTLSELWAYALGQMSEESRRRVILRAARWRVLPKDLDKDVGHPFDQRINDFWPILALKLIETH